MARRSNPPPPPPRRNSRRPQRDGVIPLLMLCCAALLLLAFTVGLVGLQIDQSSTQKALDSSSSLAQETGAELRKEEILALQDASSSANGDSEGISQAAQPAPASLEGEPAEEESLTEEHVQEVLNSLRAIFPEGMYWNHVGVDDWDEFTVTTSPCQHDLYWDTFCNGYSGGIQDLFPQFQPMEQCLGFAAVISDLVFGEDAPVNTFTDYTQVRPGDHIRLELSEHSMTVLTVDEDGITVVECNSDYQHCRISWDRFLSWEDLAAYSYEIECITRYED